jgi:amidase
MVPVAHASDGGGSIRGPSSFCGLVGFKPSRGRTQSNGLPENSPSVQLLSEHCVSRSVRDSLAWLQATERQDNALRMPSLDELRANRRQLRIGVYRNDGIGNAPGPDAAAGLELAVRTCEALGHSVVEISTPPIEARAASEAFFTVSGSMVASGLEFFRSMLGSAYNEDNLEPYTRALVERARVMPQEACIKASETLSSAATIAEKSMADFDVLLCPTVGFPAFELGRYTPDKDIGELNAFIVRVASYTFLASLAGWPAMSMPLYWTRAGLPLGSHFSAAAGKDALLFSLALQLEEALPWQPRFNALMDRLDAATA